MAAIPLGFVGAVFGHMLMGFDLTMLSLFGFVALSGVVVNDSLLLIEFINRQIRKGTGSKLDSCIRASQDRFMAIFLTTMTTFLGVTPMLLETSRQARFLQPMVISLGFGVMAATVLTLFVIPALYLILDDIIYGIRRILRLEN
jgi:multidrug efflux pump subunit AcrB